MVKIQFIKNTKSLCPDCLTVLDATIYEDEGKVYIEKKCEEHGNFKELYWSDYDQYKRAKEFDYTGNGILNPRTETRDGCPYDCGICPQHKSHTVLSIIDITNRCNLRCPVCFATAGTTGIVYEPSKEQIKEMLINLQANKPVPAAALQFSGGEPTIRSDLPELVKLAKEIGIEHVEINTNGIRLASSLDYCHLLKASGVSTVYLQFDGVTSDVYKFTRGVDLVETKTKAIDNCRKAGLTSLVLVCTLIKGVNDNQVGSIIRFAIKNFDVVRCVNFQPVSLCGRIPEEERKEMRITIPDLMRDIEEQTEGEIKSSDFYPVPTVVPVSRAVEALKNKQYVEFTVHPHCGMATYVFVEDDKIVPITRYGNVEKFIKGIEKVYDESEKGHKSRMKMTLLKSIRHIKFGMLRQYIWPLLKTGSYKSLGDLHRKMLMISSMHFMDPYNFDLERVQRCCIHYAVPDGRIIPFCSMNSIHRSQIEKKFGIPIENWKKEQNKSLDEIA